ncbi:MAG: hypothetical protein HZA54_17100 [Planctomycetes bacterium]|nr:hypothetical protein [Planctomycetota bacterium]
MGQYIAWGAVFALAVGAVFWYVNGIGESVRATLKEGWGSAAAKLDCQYYPGFFLSMPRIAGAYRTWPVEIRAILLGYFGSETHTEIRISLKEARSYRVFAAGSDAVPRPAGLEDMGYNLKNFHGLLAAKGIADVPLLKVTPEDWLNALLPGERDWLTIDGKDVTLRRSLCLEDGAELHVLVQRLSDYIKLVQRQP